ncbi:MAG: hypothetical protein IJN04_05180, partial [Clostridia bacterium]|nr:hypothetical protein [Clostridia bacterium]
KKAAARERLPEMVMRCQTSVPLPGAKPVIAPSRGYSNHQFTGGYDFSLFTLHFSLFSAVDFGKVISNSE